MRVMLAVFSDSVRLLRARKLFGISMAISLMVALFYASIGFDENGITFFFGLKKFEEPAFAAGTNESVAFYILLFTDVIVRFWLAWVVVLLGLISAVSIFPDFLAEGSIGTTLSKPVSRVGIFLLKYLFALGFVAVQVAIFSLVVFFALGLRIAEWNLGVFWAVPLVTFIFSLIYCVSVLLAVWTRSTAFALLGGLGIWGVSLLMGWAEDVSYKMGVMFPEMGAEISLESGQVTDADEGAGEGARSWNETFKAIGTPFPKTRECTIYMKKLIRFEERPSLLSGVTFDMLLAGMSGDPMARQVTEKYEQRHSLWYIFGTSAVFEAVVLGLALFSFCRKDF
ncbi:ABC-2 family transporter protein [Haloferula helveola]|uniref:ABC-2 family transporter protein n=1 Tax=Haloferula helveola TaxID=490095 RepID=A0ABM7RGA2_9BACT|nr:ABC-2 family transporter protein [Haloferula helveola]